MFQGNRVVNQNWEAAVFQDMGNSPATMDASRACDCYGSMPGNKTEIADAEQAYHPGRPERERLLDLFATRSAQTHLGTLCQAGCASEEGVVWPS